MTVNDYEEITVGEFLNKWAGFVELIQVKEENAWKRVNYLAYHLLMNNAFIDKKDKPENFNEFLNGKKQKRLTAKEFEEFING